MNCLAIDYGKKKIGLAISVDQIISPLTSINNDSNTLLTINQLLSLYQIDKVYVGMSFGRFGRNTKNFYQQLKNMLKLPVEAVDETVSTIEAKQIFLDNKGKKKNYKNQIDSISACVILSRALGY